MFFQRQTDTKNLRIHIRRLQAGVKVSGHHPSPAPLLKPTNRIVKNFTAKRTLTDHCIADLAMLGRNLLYTSFF